MEEINQKMRTHKFRFSDIMPHSWLYKLKGKSRNSRKKNHTSSPKHLSSADASSSRKLHDPLHRLSSTCHHPQASNSPPKSSSFKRKIKRKNVYKPSAKLKLSSSHVSLSSFKNHTSKSLPSANAISDSVVESSSDPVPSPSDKNYGFYRDLEPHPNDIKNDRFVKKLDDIPEEPSILAKVSPLQIETVKEQPFGTMTHKKPKTRSSGIKLRTNSPKIARKKTKKRTSPASKKKGIVKNFAIVLSSMDPEKDFRESMIEMIMENKMKEQKDLEDLLACYLSLNSSEYHDIIIKAFEKTWLHLFHLSNKETERWSPKT